MDFYQYIDCDKHNDYGPFLEYALKYKHTRISSEPEFVFNLPTQINVMIFKHAGIQWWSLSKQYFAYFLSQKPFDDIMKRISKVENDGPQGPKKILCIGCKGDQGCKGPEGCETIYENKRKQIQLAKRLCYEMMKPYYINAITENKMKNVNPIEKFKFYLRKYGFEVCIDGLRDMLHLSLYKGITKEVLEQVVKKFRDENIDLIPEFVILCYDMGIKVPITAQTAHTLIQNIWDRCNGIHYAGTQAQVTIMLNTLFDSIDFSLDVNDLNLMFTLLNKSGELLLDDHVKLIKRILLMITVDPVDQLFHALSLNLFPASDIKNRENIKTMIFRYDYVKYLIEPIKNISDEKILELCKKFSSYLYYKSLISNGAIRAGLQRMVHKINEPILYTLICDTFDSSILNWNRELYFRGCKALDEFCIKLGKKYVQYDIKGIDLDVEKRYNYLKFMTKEHFNIILNTEFNYLPVCIYYKCFEIAIEAKLITPIDITRWVIRTYKEHYRTPYESGASSLYYNKIINLSENIPALISTINYGNSLRADIAYDLFKMNRVGFYDRISKDNNELVDMILERKEPEMLSRLFKDLLNDKEYLLEKIKTYNNKGK